jgi:hypothetical protein
MMVALNGMRCRCCATMLLLQILKPAEKKQKTMYGGGY